MEQKKIAVDTEALVSAADKVDRSANDLKAGVQKFQSIIEGLNNSWSSDVKDKFFTSYEKDLKALNEMVAQYSEVSGGLRSLAEYHAKTEEEIKAKIEKAGKAVG